MMDELRLTELSAQYGLGEAYHDYRGEYRKFSPASRVAILRAMGANLDSPSSTSAQQSALLPLVRVCTQDELYCEITLEAATANTKIKAVVRTEHGDALPFEAIAHQLTRIAATVYQLPLPVALPLGYHQLTISVGNKTATCPLIVTPSRCYEPETIQQGQRCSGLSIQLYTLRSEHNWGIGDFSDLQSLIPLAAKQGCHLIGLNPLHALRPAAPDHISPYSPSHRDFLNVLYVSVPAIVEYKKSKQAQTLVNKSQKVLHTLRASDHVQYVEVARLKLEVLRMLFAEFQCSELAKDTQRAKAFRDYVAQQGTGLQRHALYDALDEHFSQHSAHRWGWRSWPDAYHRPQNEAVVQFAKAHHSQIEFYMYLQWIAAEQLSAAQQLARAQGMSIGLYGDVAVGVDPNGSEVWSNPQLYIDGASVGAPPDPLALKGQDWGIPPQHPVELQRQGYAPFVQMLRATMSAVGALRIDHVMTLCRLWWVPRNMDATQGVYVHYPLDDLVKLVALESVRSQCLVIGEDLGTVPDAMRHAMERFALYHYKVLFFEKGYDGHFKAPHEYPQRALAVVTTHDLPPFKSWWQGEDIALRSQLNMYPDEATQQHVMHEREADRRLLMIALTRAGLWHWHEHQPLPEYSFALMRAAYLYAGLSQSALLVIQPEDLMQMIDPVNVPGTSTEHANWQRKLNGDLSECLQHPEVQEMLSAMDKARRGENPNG